MMKMKMMLMQLWRITTKQQVNLSNIWQKQWNRGNRLNTEVVVPLKYLSNFWKSLDLPLINCEIELDLSWSRYCIITEISRTYGAVANTNLARY